MTDTIWTKVTLMVPPTLEDPLSDFLTTLTGRGVCINQADGGSTIEAYLSPGKREDHLLRIDNLLESFVQMDVLPQGFKYEQQEVPEEDWMAVFRSQHTTVRISDRLVIRPTWCDSTGDHEVVLDPGLAFGTGSHVTTRMCLVLLDQHVGNHPPGRMFDLGTGSGILAIAAAYLGIGDILAVDIDTVAVEVASRNVQNNSVDDQIRVAEGGIETAEGLYDIITANLSASLLKKLASDMAQHLNTGGNLIISGILEDEKTAVLEAFTRCGLRTERIMNEKVWVAALLCRTV
jgi:ribosomal protein L11 methyltransferase